MPTQRISMRKLREVCRLRFHAHLSLRQISHSTQVSLGAIQKIISTMTQQGLDWSAIQALDDTHLSALIYPKPADSNVATRKELPDWLEVHREVKPKV